MDLGVNLYEGYYNYRSAVHTLNKYKKEVDFSPRNDVQIRHDNEVIASKENEVENKKEIYIRSNIAFFTLFLAAIVFIFTVVNHNNNMSMKEAEIATLKLKIINLEQEIDVLNNNTITEILSNQNLVNNNLVLNISQLTEILNEVKKRILENDETPQR